MLVCSKCHGLCESGTARCPNCRSDKLQPVQDDDFVLLQRADEAAVHRLAERFDTAGISCRAEPAATGLHTPLFDGGAMPTDQIILVRFGDLETAEQLAREVLDELARERQPEEQLEEFEEMPLKKRLIVQTLSIILFMTLVAAVVFGADALANWLKSLFGIG